MRLSSHHGLPRKLGSELYGETLPGMGFSTMGILWGQLCSQNSPDEMSMSTSPLKIPAGVRDVILNSLPSTLSFTAAYIGPPPSPTKQTKRQQNSAECGDLKKRDASENTSKTGGTPSSGEY